MATPMLEKQRAPDGEKREKCSGLATFCCCFKQARANLFNQETQVDKEERGACRRPPLPAAIRM